MAGITYKVSYWLSRLTVNVYLRHSATGIENIPREGCFLLAVNHASFLDPVLVGNRLPRPIYYMARRTLFSPAPFGWFMRALNSVPVDRGRLSRETYREVIALLEQGEGVLVFPEGTRTRDGKLGPLRAGVVGLAQMTHAPVVPAYLAGTHRALGRGKIFPRPTRTSARYGKPIRFPEDADRQECLQLLQERMLALEAEECKVRGLAPIG